MKQLSALGARRHAFFRGPRRMRPLGGRLEDSDILGPGAYGYYGGKNIQGIINTTPSPYIFHIGPYIGSVCVLPGGFSSLDWFHVSAHRPMQVTISKAQKKHKTCLTLSELLNSLEEKRETGIGVFQCKECQH